MEKKKAMITSTQVEPWSRAVIEQNRQWLAAFVLSVTGEPSATEDLVQEVFTIAYAKRDDFEDGTNLGGWLREIARNVVARHFERMRKERLFVHESSLQALEQAAARLEASSMAPDWRAVQSSILKKCLGELAEWVRDLVDLRYDQGLSARKIAEGTGKSVSSINVALFRARIALAECMKRKAGHEL